MLRLPSFALIPVWSLKSTTSEVAGALVPGVPSFGMRPEVRNDW